MELNILIIVVIVLHGGWLRFNTLKLRHSSIFPTRVYSYWLIMKHTVFLPNIWAHQCWGQEAYGGCSCPLLFRPNLYANEDFEAISSSCRQLCQQGTLDTKGGSSSNNHQSSYHWSLKAHHMFFFWQLFVLSTTNHVLEKKLEQQNTRNGFNWRDTKAAVVSHSAKSRSMGMQPTKANLFSAYLSPWTWTMTQHAMCFYRKAPKQDEQWWNTWCIKKCSGLRLSDWAEDTLKIHLLDLGAAASSKLTPGMLDLDCGLIRWGNIPEFDTQNWISHDYI